MANLQAKIYNLLGFDPNRHSWKTEVLAGITSFLTMSYILAVVVGLAQERSPKKSLIWSSCIYANTATQSLSNS